MGNKNASGTSRTDVRRGRGQIRRLLLLWSQGRNFADAGANFVTRLCRATLSRGGPTGGGAGRPIDP